MAATMASTSWIETALILLQLTALFPIAWQEIADMFEQAQGGKLLLDFLRRGVVETQGDLLHQQICEPQAGPPQHLPAGVGTDGNAELFGQSCRSLVRGLVGIPSAISRAFIA